LGLEVYTFESQPGVDLYLYVARRSRPEQPGTVELRVLNEQGWDNWVAAMGGLFGEEFKRLPGMEVTGAAVSTVATVDTGWFDEMRERLMGESLAMAWLAPRGIGPTAWTRAERDVVQIRRRFMLLGQTLDGMRVWDIRRGLAVLREVEPFRESAIHLRGEGAMGVNLLMAGVFEPGWERLELVGIPSTFRDGPDYLNVLRFIELPQAVAMAAEHGNVRLVGVASGEWGFVERVSAALSWEPGRIELVAGQSAIPSSSDAAGTGAE
jgi:hypothetical protein